MSKTLLVVLTLCAAAGCAKAPPSLSPQGVRIWQANEAVLALGSVQHVAIQLNGIQRCEPPPNEATCAPVLSARNTGIVVDVVGAGVTTIGTVPDGWRATADTALDQIGQRLDAAGQAKLAAYLQAARAALIALGGGQ